MGSDSIQYKPKAANPVSVASVQGIGRGVINKEAWDKAYSAWCKRRGLREVDSDFAYGRKTGRGGLPVSSMARLASELQGLKFTGG